MKSDDEKVGMEWPPAPKHEILQESFSHADSKDKTTQKPSGEKRDS